MIVRLGTGRSEPGGMAWNELENSRWTPPESEPRTTGRSCCPCRARRSLRSSRGGGWRDASCCSGAPCNNQARRDDRGFQGWSQAKARLDAALVCASRSICTTFAAPSKPNGGLGIPKDHVNKVLNHAAGPFTEAYDLHSYLPEKAAALQKWADELERITSQLTAEAVEIWPTSDEKIILDTARGPGASCVNALSDAPPLKVARDLPANGRLSPLGSSLQSGPCRSRCAPSQGL
jgi:hypothetical protein